MLRRAARAGAERDGYVTGAARVSFRRWFGSSFLRHKSVAQGGLTLPEIREDRLDVEVECRRKLFACSMDFLDDRVFPHETMLP